MENSTAQRWRIALIVFLSLVLTLPAFAGKGFLGSDDADEDGEPATWLKNYDKLVKGKEADWVYFPPGTDLGAYNVVVIKPFGNNSEVRKSKEKRVVEWAAESGQEYLADWILDSKSLGWDVGDTGDLIIEGNVFNAWEPSTGARMWGGWMANPGCGIELRATDKAGNLVFEIRHKSRGSTVEDAVENGLENIVETLEKGQ